jgi:hypothetical protein
LTRSRLLQISLKGLGFALLIVLFAANVFVLHDAVNFEMGEKLGPACTYIRREVGIHPALLFFAIQLAPLAVLSIYLRSWFVFSLSVVPLWLVLYLGCLNLD